MIEASLKEINASISNGGRHVGIYHFWFRKGRLIKSRARFGSCSDVLWGRRDPYLIAYTRTSELHLAYAGQGGCIAEKLDALAQFVAKARKSGYVYPAMIDTATGNIQIDIAVLGNLADFTATKHEQVLKRAIRAAASESRKMIRKLVTACNKKLRVLRNGDYVSKYRRSNGQ